MKKNIIFAAFAAASALLLVSSCAKEELRENISAGDGKVFSAVINQDLSKTTITSEYKVNWVEGDQIDINGGTTYSATPDASDATKATFTKDSGSDPDGTFGYTAVYPASIMVGTQATLPATQTYAAGKFNAPMCAMSSTESLEFKNFCGVLCFALKGTDKVKSIAVTANEQLCGPFEFADATSIIFGEKNKGYTVTLDCGEGVQLNETTATNFYVYLPPKDSYTAGMKIVVTSTEGKTFEKTTTKSATITRNQIYTFNWTASFSSAEPEYVEIGGVKWATKNLGATTVAGSIETCAGYHFAWGGTEAYVYSDSQWKSVKDGSVLSDGFSQANAPYYESSAYTKYTSSDSNTVLESGDDAATALLGSGWRMPTSAEFKALYDACLNGSYDTTTNPSGAGASVGKGVYWCTNYDGVAGCLFCDGTNKLFFPAAGYGNGTSLFMAGSFGGYLSSSLYTSSTDFAFYLDFISGYVIPQDYDDRCYGFSVRPVKAAAAPLPAGALKGEFSVSSDKKVRFSQGNLTYNVTSTTWAFYEHQYDCATGYDADLISLFTWGYNENTSIDPDGEGYVTGHTVDGESFSAYEDWGSQIGDGKTWRTLTTAEWQYLFNTREASTVSGTSNARYAKATVDSRSGIILLPDEYEHPSGVAELKKLNPKNDTENDINTDAAFTENTYSVTDWEKMEAAGAVFLPSAGYREGSDVDFDNNYGAYWSSTAFDEEWAYYVDFASPLYHTEEDFYFIPDDADYRSCGCSARLVTDVPAE